MFKIGVIAPYRAQADLIDKLFASEPLPKEVDVQVGTIHGFQGDECDIIFAVFNTPPTISTSKEIFLNKRNIINVSTSRAKDYLFIVMPDDDTDNIENLQLVKNVEYLIKKSNAWTEVTSSELETMMFGSSNYLENNAFSTSHQSVNVYGLPEKCYEVRTEDNAVDIQIHRNVRTYFSTKTVTQSRSFPDEKGHFDGQYNPVSQTLQTNGIRIQVTGARKGFYYLIPYDGKLKQYTDKETESMFIPIIQSGREKLLPVTVVQEDSLIFITKTAFIKYEMELTTTSGVELRKTFYH